MMISKRPRPLLVVLVTIFFDLLGYGILIPVIPVLLADPSSPDYILSAKEITDKGAYILLGVLLGAQPLMQFFSAPILGQLSDRYGRKKVLLISLIGTTLSYVLFAFGIKIESLSLLFFSRILDGITGGNISVAQAIVADISPIEKRTKNYGLMGAAFGLGFIIGPFIGGKLSDPNLVSWFSVETPFWFAVILSAINFFMVVWLLVETNPRGEPRVPLNWKQSIEHIEKAFRIKELRSIFFSTFVYYSGFSFFTTFFSIFLIERLNFHQGHIGNFFAYVGIWLIFTQVVIIRYMLKNKSESQILPVAMFFAGIGIFALLMVKSVTALALVIPIFAIANGITIVNITSLVSKSGSKNVQGEILGINASVQASAQSIPPILSGFIAAILVPTSPIVVSGALMILASLVFYHFHNRDRANVVQKKVFE